MRAVPRVAERAAARSPRAARTLARRASRAAHPVEPEAPLAVARAIPGVDVPVREPALERVRLDERASTASPRPPSGTRARRAGARGSPRASVATSSSSARSTCGSGVCASSNWPNVSSSLRRTRASGVCASAAIIGPTNSSARRIARASSGVSRGARRNVSPKSSLSTRTSSPSELGVDRVAAAAEVDEVEQRQVLLELRRPGCGSARRARRAGISASRLLAARGEEVGEQRLEDGEALGRDRAGEPVERGGVVRGVGAPRPRRFGGAPSWRSRDASRAPSRDLACAARRARAGPRGRPGAAPTRRAAARDE